VIIAAALSAISIIVSKKFFSQAALFYLAVADGNVAFRLDTAEVVAGFLQTTTVYLMINQHLKNVVGGVGQDITTPQGVSLIIQILNPFVSLEVIVNHFVVLAFAYDRPYSLSTNQSHGSVQWTMDVSAALASLSQISHLYFL
jgi:hypothetical protein